MKKWTKETAKKYAEKVEKGRQEKGLSYLSALDFLRYHKKNNSIISI